jgi:predicted transposase YbfD/YdcC
VKTNEITVVPLVLKEVYSRNLLENVIITIDAMGCQKSLAELIINSSADYLLGHKANQSELHDQVKLIFSSGLNKYSGEFKSFESEEYSTYYDKGHGRIERRTIRLVRVSSSDETTRDWLPAATAWKGLATVIEVKRESTETNTNEEKEQMRYFISSADLEAKSMLECIIKHLNVETRPNILDGTFDEACSRIRRGNAPQILSAMRKLAFNLVRPLANKWPDEVPNPSST